MTLQDMQRIIKKWLQDLFKKKQCISVCCEKEIKIAKQHNYYIDSVHPYYICSACLNACDMKEI